MTARALSRATRVSAFEHTADGILAESTPIYDQTVATLGAKNIADLAWRDLFDNVWDI
jgi:hypothetical protein